MANENDTSVSAEAHAAAVSAARADGVTEGRKAGASDATARIGAILRSDAAKGKTKLAMTLAFDTDMSAEAADKVLSAAAPEAVEAPNAGGADLIGQRQAGMAEFGGGGLPAPDATEKAKSGWAKAVQSANRTIGAA